MKVLKEQRRSAVWVAGALFLAVGGLLLRFFLAAAMNGYETDINCFIGWTNRLHEVGLRSFYSKEVFSDYPPGYLYILYMVGFIKEVFSIDFNSALGHILIKMPAILCDMAAGLLIYRIGIYYKKKPALCFGFAAAYIFNPAVLINSSIWGQVDSVFTLFIVIACYEMIKGNLPLSYFMFAIAVVIKPQSLIFTPVILYGFFKEIFKNHKFDLKRFSRQCLWALGAVVFMIVLMAPFGILTVVNQYIDTLTSYPYASVNAYNFWSMLGLNWAPQTELLFVIPYYKLGTVFIFAIVGITCYFAYKGRKDESIPYFLAVSIITGMFCLSVRMHERYWYPVLIFLLLLYVAKQKKYWLVLYGAATISHYLNVSDVLNNFGTDYAANNSKTVLYSVFTVIIYSCILFYGQKCYGEEKVVEENELIKETGIQKTKDKLPWKKEEIIVLICIIAVYSCLAFYHLGDRTAPESFWNKEEGEAEVIVDLGKETEISSISYYLGNYENRNVTFEAADVQDGLYTEFANLKMESVFCWKEEELNQIARFVKIKANDNKVSIGEIVFHAADGGNITPKVVYGDGEALFDEQDLCPERSSYLNSTYFDEIYHARTAYEYIHGLYSYENTHPPLGKIFISLGIRIFGMNPFGYRVMGTLFGIAMLPLIYLFGRKFTRSRFAAAVVCLLLSVDFMHFTQTRIATIDVFVTFFIIAMYLFMYDYIQKSFYDNSLKKLLLPLLLCGISMGFGIACKWTGVYAGVGLGIIFFLNLFCRYKEYRQVKEGNTNIAEEELKQKVLTVFPDYMKKIIMWCILFFIVLPAFIYTLSYLPFEDESGRGMIAQMIANQQSMFSYHSGIEATHPFSSWWYQWPVMYRPIWYYSGTVSDSIKEGISAFGNPLIWWIGIPVLFYMIYRAVKLKDRNAVFLVTAYLAQYVPWFFVTRITFIYHYFPSVPFVILMIGYCIWVLIKEKQIKRRGIFIYLGVAAVLFVLFYPVLSGYPVAVDYVEYFLKWFPSWILI